MEPNGTYDRKTRTLTVYQSFPDSIDAVWPMLTQSDRLATWYGTYEGDPTSGAVTVTMTAEAEPVPPMRCDVLSCDPPTMLAVAFGERAERWQVAVRLTGSGTGTDLALGHEDLDARAVEDCGPGWQWYLDRMAGALAGDRLPDLDDFERDYAPLAAAYRHIAGIGDGT